METRDKLVLKKIKSAHNKVRNETRKLLKVEQQNVAGQCKQNPKIFWKYINSKHKTRSTQREQTSAEHGMTQIRLQFFE